MSALHRDSPKVQDWIARAKAANILDVAKANPVCAALKRAGASEWIGPCPCCGGEDRFSINTKEGVFNCRGSEGGKGPIDLVMHALSCDFLTAVETITGEMRSDGAREETPEEKAKREGLQRQRDAANTARRDQEERAAAARLMRDEEAIACVMARAVPIQGTPVEAYLRARGLTPAKRLTGDLLSVADLDYFGYAAEGDKALVHLATLPAMVAVIRDVAGDVIGIHCTYLDPKAPSKWRPIGSSANKAKKIRGSSKGGMIRLGAIGDKIAISEGIETGLSWHALGCGPEDISLAAGISLGNIAGGCTGTLPHPTRKGANGNPTPFPNGIPDMSRPGVILPEGVREVILIGDGDSEQLATWGAIRTGARRFQAEGRVVAVHWAPDGFDFNDVLMSQHLEMEKAA